MLMMITKTTGDEKEDRERRQRKKTAEEDSGRRQRKKTAEEDRERRQRKKTDEEVNADDDHEHEEGAEEEHAGD